ncbi:MAG TPA: TIGR00730 family Rossman fold protein [Flavisolibacter sp.]
MKSAAIFCGSKTGNREIYREHAISLALILAENRIELVYGGGRNGIMGIVADTVMDNGGIVRGVIPQMLKDWEHQHENLSELLVVDDMHVRKRRMYELCDAAIILPGGFGTLDELFEILTWNQLSLHDKKVFILNSDGFYDHLVAHMKHLEAEGFLWGNFDEQVTVLRTPEDFRAFIAG